MHDSGQLRDFTWASTLHFFCCLQLPSYTNRFRASLWAEHSWTQKMLFFRSQTAKKWANWTVPNKPNNSYRSRTALKVRLPKAVPCTTMTPSMVRVIAGGDIWIIFVDFSFDGSNLRIMPRHVFPPTTEHSCRMQVRMWTIYLSLNVPISQVRLLSQQQLQTMLAIV